MPPPTFTGFPNDATRSWLVPLEALFAFIDSPDKRAWEEVPCAA
jgi:hypothetical protein